MVLWHPACLSMLEDVQYTLQKRGQRPRLPVMSVYMQRRLMFVLVWWEVEVQ